jgi:diguanylate cyclase (GGDEF)-like protein
VRGKRLALLEGLIACGGAALLVAISGGGQGFWLTLPIALLLAGAARTVAQASLAASAVTVAGIVAAGSTAPPLPLILLVTGGSVAILRIHQERFERERRALRSTAMKDPLTGAANRRAFAERLRYEVARHARQEHDFAVVALDLDGFKSVNDRFGHIEGDRCLQRVADALRGTVRGPDACFRWGGDEFALVLPSTGREAADRVAERVGSAVEAAVVLPTGEPLRVRCGSAEFEDGMGAEALLNAADAALIAAKRHGPDAGALSG